MPITKISRYIVKSELGQGGMATVYHGYDPSFERDVAIKVMPDSLLADPQFRTRFEREAKTIARLEHSAIVPVYDVGEENNQPFIVMRYMSGGSLADRIKEKPISPQECSTIFTRLAPALDAAHTQGIIHRDIKPANILLDQYGNSFLSDFGIARMTQGESSTLTGGFILGTPAYMSPEQARGEPNLDSRSDIYALGATLYEMMSGKVPFEADTPMGQALKQIMEPTPNIIEIKPDLPIGVQEVINKAMEKDRALRYKTVTEMAEALSDAVKSQGTVLSKPTSLKTELMADATLAANPQAISAAAPTAIAQPGISLPHDVTQPPVAKKKPISKLWIGLGVVLISLIIIGGTIIGMNLVSSGNNQATINATLEASKEMAIIPPGEADTPVPSPIATNTSEPSPTVEEPTPTLELATETPTAEVVLAPVIGGADKVAYLIENNIWMVNLDGSDPVQLTIDNTSKSDLEWGPDRVTLFFLSGNCLRSVNSETSQVNDVTCFKTARAFEDFEISKDGKQIALSVNNQLFIVPFDLEKLSQANSNSTLTAIAECAAFAPYERNAVTAMQWSNDSTKMAINILGVLDDGRRGDIIQIISLEFCVTNPQILDNFPPPRFVIDEYKDIPTIQGFSWDGEGLFALSTIVRNKVFGNIYFYNSELRQGFQENPIDGKCCYTDPVWSPDGSFLFFTYQDFSLGQESQNLFYFVPYSDITAKGVFTPLPLPPVTDLRTSIQPALRMAP